MKLEETMIHGVLLIHPEIQNDQRGNFYRTFCVRELAEHGIRFRIVQANESFTQKKGTIRGIHFQKTPHEEEKIVRCVQGKIFDVVVDLRKKSKTYMKWLAFTLSEQNHTMVYIPKGCGHGFQTLTDSCVADYFMSEFYSKNHASGIRWDDQKLKIRWPMLPPAHISKKDNNLPLIRE